jgi:hypothetical protein
MQKCYCLTEILTSTAPGRNQEEKATQMIRFSYPL